MVVVMVHAGWGQEMKRSSVSAAGARTQAGIVGYF